MRPRFKVLTLAVDDLERSLAFYREGLGLETEGVIGTEFEDGAVAFFPFNGDQILALYPAASLAKDAGIASISARTGAISIGHITRSREEVDRVLKAAADAGGTIADPARDRFWGGYSGYFKDPDGHLWEVAWHPEWSKE